MSLAETGDNLNYILLDLEWNSAYSSKHQKFVNEIIEIGAVKLNERLEEIDSFRVIIRSALTKRLSGRFKTLTNITNEEMRAGISFKDGLELYTNWVASDDITMTWSNTDLYVLLENCRLFADKERIPCIYRYIDVQKFVQNELAKRGLLADAKQQISLCAAASLIGIDTSDLDLHRAETDSRLTCLLLKETYDKDKLEAMCQDTAVPDYYDRLTYKAYVISDINSPYVDKKQMKFSCDECGAAAKRVSKWSFKSRRFCAQFRCTGCCKEFIGRVTFKKMYDRVDVKRTTAPISPVQEATQEE